LGHAFCDAEVVIKDKSGGTRDVPVVPRRYQPQPEVGRAIRTLRIQRGLTQRQLAAKADVEVTWLSRLERGHANPSLDTLRRLAQALGVRLSKLIAQSEKLEPSKDLPT